MLVDHCLRSGFYETAIKLAQDSDIEVGFCIVVYIIQSLHLRPVVYQDSTSQDCNTVHVFLLFPEEEGRPRAVFPFYFLWYILNVRVQCTCMML